MVIIVRSAYIGYMSKMNTMIESDITPGDWVDRWTPPFIRPYMRLARADRPIGAWLLLIPCWWGLALASNGWPDWSFIALFFVGAFVMRAAGCTVNDLADRNFDRVVARTANRPIASGQLTVFHATVFLVILLIIGLAILLQFNTITIYLGVASLLLVAIYPFMKRFTYWPQAFLGLTFNWGSLMGWTTISGELNAPALWLYAAGVCWTLGYDTIYAHQDKADDLLAGVKSTALKFGEHTLIWLILFYCATIILLGTIGVLMDLAWPYFVGLSVGAGHFLWQLLTVNLDIPVSCLKVFKSNRDFGLIIFGSIILARVI